ncbi:cell division protein CrgA [Nonomuraea angiospora]|uniref:cell division protein CrgA n=1 Tax=Nonomuraea angiospora TaxID=46172 RepID=UPI00345012D4
MSDLQARVAPNNRLARRLAAAMGVSWFLGVAWIVLYYVDPTLPILSDLGNWNLLAGVLPHLAGRGVRPGPAGDGDRTVGAPALGMNLSEPATADS